MFVKFRFYENTSTYGKDYNSVRNFLIELDSHNYHFGHWDWMIMSMGAEWADPDGIEKIGIWEDGDKTVAIATYDTKLGSAYLLTQNEYEKLKGEMLHIAKANLAKDGMFAVLILDGDLEMQNIAAQNNFFPTQDKECDAIYPIQPEKIKYDLPPGFHITSFKDNLDLYKYGQALWKGFNHEIQGEGPFSFHWEKHSEKYIKQWDRPNN